MKRVISVLLIMVFVVSAAAFGASSDTMIWVSPRDVTNPGTDQIVKDVTLDRTQVNKLYEMLRDRDKCMVTYKNFLVTTALAAGGWEAAVGKVVTKKAVAKAVAGACPTILKASLDPVILKRSNELDKKIRESSGKTMSVKLIYKYRKKNGNDGYFYLDDMQIK